jgi:WD40 repeat protein
MLPGPGQVLPGPGPGQRPPRRNTGLIVGGSVAAAVVLVAGAIVGITLSSQHSSTSGSPGPSGSTTSSASPTPSGSETVTSKPAQTGTATLAGSVTAPGGNSMTGAFFSRDGKYIAGATGKSDVYIWSTSTFQLVNTVSAGSAGDTVDPESFSPDDKTLYAVDITNRELYDLDIATGKQTHAYPLPPDALDWAYDSGMLDAIASDGSVSEINLATGQVYATVKNPGNAAPKEIRSDADGKYVLFSDTNGAAYLVDALSNAVVGIFQYPYSGSGTVYPEVSLEGNTVYVPGGSTAPAKLWDTTTKSYITPTDPLWPTPDGGLTFSTDGKFDLTSPTTVSETVDIWNIATRAHVLTLTVPGGANEAVQGIGPGASELLSTSGLNINKGTFGKLNIWAIPG